MTVTLLQPGEYILSRISDGGQLQTGGPIIIEVPADHGRFEQVMNTVITGLLAIVVNGGVQWHMGVGQVVAQIGGQHHRPFPFPTLESFLERLGHSQDMPGQRAPLR